jgi:Retrotransposon gag protein
VPRILLDYAAPRVTNVRGPIRLPRLTRESCSYSMSTISILQNNYYHRLEHEYPHDHIQTFLQCLGAVRLNEASKDYIRLALFSFTLKDRAKRWFNSLLRDSVGTWENLSNLFSEQVLPSQEDH